MKLAFPLALALFVSLKLIGCASSEQPISSGGGGGEAGSSSNGGSAGHAGHAGAEAIDQCCMLGAVCHVVGESSAEVEECHHIGHKNEARECAVRYDECMEICAGQNDHPEPHSCST